MKMDFVSQNKELNRGLTPAQMHRVELPVDIRRNNRQTLKPQQHEVETEEPGANRRRRSPREDSFEAQRASQAQEEANETKNISFIPEVHAATSVKFLSSTKMFDSQLGHNLRLSSGQPGAGRLTSALPGHRLESATTGVQSRKLGKLKFD